MATQQGFIKRAPGRFQVGSWIADAESLLLSQGATSVRVRPKVMDLLVTFAERPGKVSSTEFLIARVWPDVVVGDSSLSVLVVELRKILGDDPKSPRFIETIPRRGYRLIAPISEIKPAKTTHFALASTEGKVLLHEGENLVGRDPEAGIRIDSNLVSRRHSLIIVTGDSATIQDLDSKNGTYLNGRRLEEAEPLSHGDRITLGRLAMRYRFVIIDDEPTVTEVSKVVDLR